MAEDAARFLGFAFASADLLFEVEPSGKIGFAIGASKKVAGVTLSDLTSADWQSFISEEDVAVVAAFLGGVGPGDRRGPIRVRLKPEPGRKLKRYAALSACRLPQLDPRVSCAMTLHSLAALAGEPSGPHGLHNAEGFNAAAAAAMKQAAQSGVELNMELVELPGLKKAAESLGKEAGAQAMVQVAAALRAESIDGSAAAEIERDRYAVLRARRESSARIAERLDRTMGAVGLTQVATTLNTMELDPEGPGEGLRVLRVALDRFMAGGSAGLAAGASLSGLVRKTAQDASQFKSNVAHRRFGLVYQPVVDLKSGAAHHFEVLVRLGDESPAEAIQMAEGMEIIQDLDFAVAQAVVSELKKPARSALRLAANVSARSLMQPAFMDKLETLIRANSDIRGRLILEITESSAISDLAAADAVVRRLRRHGCKVALDDFGAGAASFDYLRSIAVDEIKIDGRYIRELTSAQDRAGVMVRHLTDLCKELSISTVAEMIETEDTAEILRQIGVDYGQGYLFGKPTPEPIMTLRRPAPAAPTQAAKTPAQVGLRPARRPDPIANRG